MVSDCRLTLGQTPLQHIASHHATLLPAQVKRVEERLLARGILLRVDEAALDFLADRGFDPAYGEAALTLPGIRVDLGAVLTGLNPMVAAPSAVPCAIASCAIASCCCRGGQSHPGEESL